MSKTGSNPSARVSPSREGSEVLTWLHVAGLCPTTSVGPYVFREGHCGLEMRLLGFRNTAKVYADSKVKSTADGSRVAPSWRRGCYALNPGHRACYPTPAHRFSTWGRGMARPYPIFTTIFAGRAIHRGVGW